MSDNPFDPDFDIVISKNTIKPEEIPRLCQRIGAILVSAADAYAGLTRSDPERVAAAAVVIAEQLRAIKKMLED